MQPLRSKAMAFDVDRHVALVVDRGLQAERRTEMMNNPGARGRWNVNRAHLTAADIDEQRRALEAIGREAWERATREGRDVPARTTQELRALGAHVLSQAAGSGKAGEIQVTALRDPSDVGHGADDYERVMPDKTVELRPNLDDMIDKSAGKRLYMTLEANWDPSRSSGKNIRATPGLLDAGEKHKADRRARGDDEPIALFFPTQHGDYTLGAPAGEVRTGSSNGDGLEPSGFHAEAALPGNESAAIHWHPDDAMGFVDNPSDRKSKGFGDSYYLQSGKPIATVYKGEVAWRELQDGRLVFRYPTGTMSKRELDEMQRNLDREQRKFYRARPK